MYLCIIYIPRVCRTWVPEIHVLPEMLRVLWYIDVVHMRDKQLTVKTRS